MCKDAKKGVQQNRGLVVLIDDDRVPMEDYVHALELKGFEVLQFYGTDPLFTSLEKEQPDIVAIVLDIMIPAGERYARKDTDEGLETGVFVYRDLREMERYATVPIVVLTNSTNQQTLSKFPKELVSLWGRNWIIHLLSSHSLLLT